MFLAGLSFVCIALIQTQLDAGHKPSVLWQIGPYVLLTLGEVLVSVTGLEFAYSQAPPSMKSAIQSFWLLTTFAGNLVVAVLARLKLFTGTSALLFYAALVAAAAVGLALVARHHVDRTYFRQGVSRDVTPAPPPRLPQQEEDSHAGSTVSQAGPGPHRRLRADVRV
jgi:POT family proton-dependent oligopeptide transporter